MRVGPVCARGVVLFAVVAAACGDDADSNNDVKCGAGTVLKGGECVASAGNGGGGGEAGNASGGSGAKAGSAGIGGMSMAGSGNAGGEPAEPMAGSPGTDGGFSNGGTPEPNADAGAAGAGQAGMSSSGQGGSGGEGGDASDGVKRSSGCGKPFAGTSGAKVTIQTSGVKDVGCEAPKCGAWSTPRDYYVYLPADYDPATAYNLLLEGPGCGLDGTSTQVYGFEDDIHGTAIRVGLTPGADSISSWGQGCFDAREGDDSIDFVFYEQLFDKLEGELCFDKQRVFAAGNSAGGFLANELACKYAGDPLRPIRGVLSNSAGLPSPEDQRPTCVNAPVAGMWVHGLLNNTFPFTLAKLAIDYAIQTNGCSSGTSYDTAQFEDYPISVNLAADTCQKVVGCPELYPVVVCAIPNSGHSLHLDIVDPGFARLVTELPPL